MRRSPAAATKDPGRPAGLLATARRRRAVTTLLLAAVAVVPVAAPAAAQTVTPSSGGPRASFEITFAARATSLDLQIEGPGKCAELDSLEISGHRAQTGEFRFGPRVPGARPRRNGKRVRRWCRGAYRVDVVAYNDEFDWEDQTTIATGRFSVR